MLSDRLCKGVRRFPRVQDEELCCAVEVPVPLVINLYKYTAICNFLICIFLLKVPRCNKKKKKAIVDNYSYDCLL